LGSITNTYFSRTVSRNAGEELAAEYDCHFYEASAAEDYLSVEEVFHELIKDIARMNEQNSALQPLFISESSSSAVTNNNAHAPLRRTKSPKNADNFRVNQKKDDAKVLPRRTVSTFKIFNKSFKIFN
jgi:Ras-like protein family protein 12